MTKNKIIINRFRMLTKITVIAALSFNVYGQKIHMPQFKEIVLDCKSFISKALIHYDDQGILDVKALIIKKKGKYLDYSSIKVYENVTHFWGTVSHYENKKTCKLYERLMK